MPAKPTLSKVEHARRGEALYEQQIRPLVEAGNEGRIVAIDVQSGAFEVAKTVLDATDRLYAHMPDALAWVVRIGHRAVWRIGNRMPAGAS
jgi:hypothetical protein